jgi:hypothetical protein
MFSPLSIKFLLRRLGGLRTAQGLEKLGVWRVQFQPFLIRVDRLIILAVLIIVVALTFRGFDPLAAIRRVYFAFGRTL